MPATKVQRTRTTLQSVLQELQQLQEQFWRREQDASLEALGGTVYYAMDNDVTTAVTAPWLDEGSNVFGPLLTDDLDAPQAFATIFAEYVFNSGPQRPFFLIPPAHNELEGNWNQVYSKAAEAMAAVDDHFERLISGASVPAPIDATSSDAELFAAIEQAVSLIHGGPSPATELRRIARLNQSACLRRIDVHLDDAGKPIAAIPSELEDGRFAAMSKKWRRLLDRSRPEAPDSNEIDATVLATLQFVNEDYGTGSKRRLCLVTGDSHILSAASDVEWAPGVSFSRQFLRRPTAFLADKEFFANAGVQDRTDDATMLSRSMFSSVARWMREIAYIHLERQGDRDAELSRELIASISKARDSWGEYLRSTSAIFRVSDQQLKELAHYHHQAARYIDQKEVERRFRELREQAALVGDEAKVRFATAGALSRFWSADAAPRSRPVRSLPFVQFNGQSEASRTAKRIWTLSAGTIEALQRNRSWLTSLRREDPSELTAMLLFSLAFASLAEWKTAYNVAQLAFAIGKTQASLGATTSVRVQEAAYLCAVFGRQSARNLEELSSCTTWLDEFQRHSLNAPVDLAHPVDRRSLVERIASRVTRALFLRFSGTADESSIAQAFAKTVEAFHVLLADCLSQLSQLEKDDVGFTHLRNQLLVNAIQCAILSEAPDETSVLVERALKAPILEAFYALPAYAEAMSPAGSAKARTSAFSEFVTVCGALVFASDCLSARDIAWGTEIAHNLGATLDQMPFDKSRAAVFLARISP